MPPSRLSWTGTPLDDLLPLVEPSQKARRCLDFKSE